MLEAILSALCQTLEAGELSVIRSWPDKRLETPEPVVAVSLKKAALSGGAFGDYLGEGESGSVRGFVCDARFALDVCLDPAAGSEGISAETDKLLAAVWSLSGELGPGNFTIGETGYDRALGRLCCRCELGARFWLVRDEEVAPELQKFTVKGMILHGNE